MTDFKEIKPNELKDNVFKILGEDWALLSAKNKQGKVNSMTVAWGGFGVMWHKPVVFAVVRPQRHTKKFIDESEFFSFTFFEQEHKEKLKYLGSVSGKDEDKMEKVELDIINDKAPYFEQARLAVICKKLYEQDFKEECFIDKKLISDVYPTKDYHTMYVAEIDKILIKE